MTLTLGPILHSAGIDPADTLVIRHAYLRVHAYSGRHGVHANSTDDEILQYTQEQSTDPRRFPTTPARGRTPSH